ncbi:MAG: sugar transferase [Tenuifilum sp.]|uniref:sugar transferase n=1 Tax=Tenuifilum sp. TaxID=2760880 RepID=UPI001B6733C9|nr:sugar transferase [Bacteroidales bacterium]HOK59996.1 sugar transferase [Tenuifilum sp.]MBP9028449.1 sugar transferase [Bacteroidales bacterium]HOK84782.1 sugar transferase [Tenuifilum sp.]HON69440.1 sugar transferase [Tenuifilum sp.]
MNKKKQAFRYLLFDVAGSALAWTLFNLYRKRVIESNLFGIDIRFNPDYKFYLGLVFFTLFWVSMFGLVGLYHDPYRKSRLREFGASLTITIIGTIVLFFVLLIDDYVVAYQNYYKILLAMFLLVFALTYTPRLVITTQTIHRIHNRKIGYPTIIVGSGKKAMQTYNDINSEKISQGYRIIGFIDLPNGVRVDQSLILGSVNNIPEVVARYGIEEVILAIDNESPQTLTTVLNLLVPLNVNIKAIPSMYDILLGKVKLNRIIGTTLVDVSFEPMPAWQANLKEMLDYFIAIVGLLLSAPVALILMAVIKTTSKGPVIFKQERIGQHGKPFHIYKFRSMYVDAEANGPALSNQTDPRVTPVGRFMRKTRLDEIPNFINVLKGEMSIVGPRPERQFYIDQLVKVAPHYLHLQKVKPGITSWGQVKYGYAENIEQMVERLKYDLLYLENMSLYIDFKIMIYTILTIFKGKGV